MFALASIVRKSLTSLSFRSVKTMFSMLTSQCSVAFLVNGELGSLMSRDAEFNVGSSLVK